MSLLLLLCGRIVEMNALGRPPSTGSRAAPLEDRVVAALTTRPMTRTALQEHLGVRNKTLRTAIDRLLSAGRLVRAQNGLAVHTPAPVPVSLLPEVESDRAPFRRSSG